MPRLTYDWPIAEGDPPGPGDVLEACRRDGRPTGTRYLIVAAREVRRRAPFGLDTLRLRLEVGRVDGVPVGVRVEPLYWWPRRRRRRFGG